MFEIINNQEDGCTKALARTILNVHFLFSVFTVSGEPVYENIPYPLRWADESMTVMHGKRALKYSCPKVPLQLIGTSFLRKNLDFKE
jgi:hypothetical protein